MFVVCYEDAALLGGNKEVLVIAVPFPPKVPSSQGAVARRPQELGDLESHIVVNVEGSQGKS